MAIRFHPSQAKDAVPVIAPLEEFVIGSVADFSGRPVLGHEPSRPAASQGHAPARGVFHSVSEADHITKKKGITFLLEKQKDIEKAKWDRQFWEDLTDQSQFPWPFLVAGLPGGPEVLQNGVEQFLLVWVGEEWQRPAFFIRQKSGSEWVLFLNTKEVWHREAVADIYWA